MQLLQWWYNLTTYPDIPWAKQTLKERENKRYARLISLFTLVILSLVLISLPGTLSFSSFLNIDNLNSLVSLTLCIGTLLLNRQGYIIAAGICCVLGVMLAILIPATTLPLDTSVLPLSAALVITVVLAGAILPPIFALVVASINCVIITSAILLLPHTSALKSAFNGNEFAITLTLISLQIIVAIVIFTIMQNLLSTIRRADDAEQIAALQQEVTQQAQTLARVNQQLEEGIQKIAKTHAEVANGNLDSRVSLSDGNVLWSIAIPLNNLLNRTQRWRIEVGQSHSLQETVEAITADLRKARKTSDYSSLLKRRNNTYVDPLLQEIYYMHTEIEKAQQELRNHL